MPLLRRPWRGALCAAALWGATFGGSVRQAAGYETLAEFMGTPESFVTEASVVEPLPDEPLGDSTQEGESLLQADSPLAGERVMQQPLAASPATTMPSYPDYGDDHYGAPPDDGSQQMMGSQPRFGAVPNKPNSTISGAEFFGTRH